MPLTGLEVEVGGLYGLGRASQEKVTLGDRGRPADRKHKTGSFKAHARKPVEWKQNHKTMADIDRPLERAGGGTTQVSGDESSLSVDSQATKGDGVRERDRQGEDSGRERDRQGEDSGRERDRKGEDSGRERDRQGEDSGRERDRQGEDSGRERDRQGEDSGRERDRKGEDSGRERDRQGEDSGRERDRQGEDSGRERDRQGEDSGMSDNPKVRIQQNIG